MVTINKRLAAFVLWFAVAAFASPSFAQQSDNHMSDARAKAIHECNIRAAKYKQYTWGVTEVTKHGQQE